MRYMLRLIGLLFALLMAFGAPGSGLIASATAAGTCDQAVVDDAGVFQGQFPQVQAQATAIANLGADVRVRTVSTIGSAATLDSYERDVEQSCSSWQSTDGGRKNNLIVLMVAIQERTTGLYYGAQWQSALGSSWPRIQGDIMNPRFRDGDFAGGVVAGLQEVDRLVDLQLHPQSVPAPGSTLQPAAPPAPDLSGVGRAVTILLIAAMLFGGVFAMFRIGSTFQAARARKRLAQQQALTAQRAVVSRVTSYATEFQELDFQLELLAGQVADAEMRPLRGQRAEAQRLADQAARDYGTTRDSVPDPEETRLSAAEYDNIAASYDRILVTTKQADDLESAMRGSMDEIERWLKTTPEAMDAANTALDPAVRRLQAVAQSGFKTTQNQAVLDRARRMLAQASAAWREKRVSEAQRQAAAASTLVDQAVATAEQYGTRQQELLKEAERVTERVAALQSLSVAADDAVAAMRAAYPPSVLEAIGNDQARMVEAVRAVGALASQARALASMEQQEWDQAQGVLTQATSRLDDIQGRLEAINTLQASLDQAQREAPAELAAAQSAVEQAAAAIAQLPAGSQGAFGEEMDAVRRRLREAEDEATLSKPDVIQVVTLAKEARGSADALAARARAERERIDRDEERRKAITRGIVTSILINAALNGGRPRGWGGRGPGGPPSFGGGGSSGWGGSAGGGGSSKW